MHLKIGYFSSDAATSVRCHQQVGGVSLEDLTAH